MARRGYPPGVDPVCWTSDPGESQGGGGPDGSSQQVPGRVPERSRRVVLIVGSVRGGGGEIAWDLGWFARRVGETSS